MEKKWKLKDPKVCRVFFSSPFNGMEGEREALTSQYWPQIQSLCNSRGVQFVPVDMRWGITLDHSAASQTIKICLREIDRSDVFVGFFGQRYGWQGINDEALQASFDVALPIYPWLKDFRERSVTELEFLHGHLKNPGQLPAFICFRDKAYDDKFREEGLSTGDKRMVYKFSSESDVATQLMGDLKSRVKESEHQTVGINMAYSTPGEGARQMFDTIMKVLNVYLLDSVSITHLSNWGQEMLSHAAFCDTRCGVYFGGEETMSKLNVGISGPSSRVVVTGDAGCGKSALLCNWLRSIPPRAKQIVAYYMIGCTSQSSFPKVIARSLIMSIEKEKWEQCGALENLSEQQKLDKENSFFKTLQEMNDTDIVLGFERKLKEVTAEGFSVVIIVDGVNKTKDNKTISKPVYWMPKDLPDEVHIIVSTHSNDDESIDELVARGYAKLEVRPLELQTRTELCKDALMLRGKELSTEQLQRIVGSDRTKNPLFLVITLEELCNFGKFRFLDKRIDTLIESDSAVELFGHLLQRLEEDYNTDELKFNLVEQVVCTLCLSRKGWRERDLCTLHSIQSHQWTPLYYALEKYLSVVDGRIGIGFTEFEDAIFERYIPSEDRKQEYLVLQLAYYFKRLQEELTDDQNLVYSGFIVWEVCWLCVEANDKNKLFQILTTIPIFIRLQVVDKYEVLQYIHFLGIGDEKFKKDFGRELNETVARIYVQRENNYQDPNPIDEFVDILGSMCDFLDEARYYSSLEYFLKRKASLLEKNCRCEEERYQRMIHETKYRLACCYVDWNQYDKALPLHSEVKEYFEKLVEEGTVADIRNCKKNLALSYNGFGAMYLKQKLADKLGEAKEYFKKSAELHSQLTAMENSEANVLKAHMNLAQTIMYLGDYHQAIEKYETIVEEQDRLYVNVIPPTSSYTLSNLGICYRYTGQNEKAKVVYEKAMEIKVKAYGDIHEDVAIGFYSFGKLSIDMNDFEQALAHFQRAMDVLETLRTDDLILGCMTRECMTQCLAALTRFEDAEEHFWKYYEYRERHNDWAHCLQTITYAMMDGFFLKKEYDKVRKVANTLADSREPFVSDERVWYLLHMCDDADPPPEGAPPPPYLRSLDRGIEVNPGSRLLIETKIKRDLAPGGDLAAINALLKQLYDHLMTQPKPENQDDMELDYIIYAPAEAIDQNCPQHLIGFYEYWKPTFLTSRVILRNLAVEYYKNKQYEDAYDCFKTAHEHEPDDPALVDKMILSSLMAGMTDTCKEAVSITERKWPDNQQLMDQVAKYKDFIVQIEQERAKEDQNEST